MGVRLLIVIGITDAMFLALGSIRLDREAERLVIKGVASVINLHTLMMTGDTGHLYDSVSGTLRVDGAQMF